MSFYSDRTYSGLGEVDRTCAKIIRPASQLDPPEYCDNGAMEGSQFCAWHQEYDPNEDGD